MRHEKELRHHGIQGMKWGIRRYQNEDGTLTALGRRRLGYENNEPLDGYRHIATPQEREKLYNQVGKDYKNMSTGLLETSKGMGRVGNISNRVRSTRVARKRQKAKNAIDLSSITDNELQKMVNRMNLERNYKNLATEHIGAGQDYVTDILATAGDVVAIGASVASIAMAISMIKGGGL